MEITQEIKDEATKTIIDNTQLDISFLTINALATVVSCSGLLANSTAVIIGSMLIATLLSPIAGTALALTSFDKKGVSQGLKALSLGVLLVMAIAYLYGHCFIQIEATDSMLSRTTPGVFDFLIAFFGGIAGGISILFKRYNGVMIGVGIATALVPPLSTAGIFFAKCNFNLGFKAFELALINIAFILLANYLVFKYFKLTYRTSE
ncbi:MAG: TIGR00341 family protein [Chitinophagales bacterium]